jgi:hypothetical protein
VGVEHCPRVCVLISLVPFVQDGEVIATSVLMCVMLTRSAPFFVCGCNVLHSVCCAHVVALWLEFHFTLTHKAFFGQVARVTLQIRRRHGKGVATCHTLPVGFSSMGERFFEAATSSPPVCRMHMNICTTIFG